jgi:hypothetical protein
MNSQPARYCPNIGPALRLVRPPHLTVCEWAAPSGPQRAPAGPRRAAASMIPHHPLPNPYQPSPTLTNRHHPSHAKGSPPKGGWGTCRSKTFPQSLTPKEGSGKPREAGSHCADTRRAQGPGSGRVSPVTPPHPLPPNATWTWGTHATGTSLDPSWERKGALHACTAFARNQLTTASEAVPPTSPCKHQPHSVPIVQTRTANHQNNLHDHRSPFSTLHS